ncbi:peptidoglycan-binding protein [Streptomyces zhihengii]|uniref:Peptidoglycan-binding protein n=1 Tax=Streptomyces zhihengii TaxID=1818004 RepID=A0ABS2US36_9ACTN|nr:peptidoglycan-binding domain-containing protein [Streptomyces zhihengii]MBM9619677.1 peptidoglycan-binding protein [Streptomyces zhihengii]
MLDVMAYRRIVGIGIAALVVLSGSVISNVGTAHAATYSCHIHIDDRGYVSAGHYVGTTVQPSSTSVTEAGKEAQCLLKYYGHNPGTVDGIFGSNSQTAAKKAQRIANDKCDAGLAVDGKVGPKTWPALRFEYCVTP